MRIRNTVFIIIAIGGVTLLLAETRSKVASNPAFDKMKSLVGKWNGSAMEGGKAMPTNARFQLISDGSALMAWLNEGVADEMVTMFHMDGTDLIGTHYCSAHNHARMVLASDGDANKLVVKFKGGTNSARGAGHVQDVTVYIDSTGPAAEVWS